MTPTPDSPARRVAIKILKAIHKEYGFYVEDLLSGKSRDTIIEALISEAMEKQEKTFKTLCMVCFYTKEDVMRHTDGHLCKHLERAIAAERERCAKIVEKFNRIPIELEDYLPMIAKEIRDGGAK